MLLPPERRPRNVVCQRVAFVDGREKRKGDAIGGSERDRQSEDEDLRPPKRAANLAQYETK
jgi:hypothetical protein